MGNVLRIVVLVALAGVACLIYAKYAYSNKDEDMKPMSEREAFEKLKDEKKDK
ncbi:MAG: hypothetical protein KHZ61_00260 [Lachnospiraceae bacterium]|nr:hypothetical protein [Lachnospiraceae bacterium]